MRGRNLTVLIVFALLGLTPAYSQGVSLAIGTASGSPGSTVSISLSLTTASGLQPAALQWTLGYSPADVSGMTWTVGATAAAAGKQIVCSGNTCIVYGLNANTISDGVVAVASAQIAPTSLATVIPLQFAGVVAASGASDGIPALGLGGLITVNQLAPSLSSLVCTPGSVVAPGSTGCMVSLTSSALTGGLLVALSSNSGAAVVPSSVTIPAGQTSASFTVTVPSATADQTAIVTAAVGTLAKTQTLSVVSPAQVSALACTPANVASGASSTCTVTLSKAAPVGTTVTFSTNASALTIPSSLPISPGATSMAFTATAGIVANDQSASITASVGGSTGGASITLLDSQQLALVTGYSQSANQLRNNFGGWVGSQFTVGSSALAVASLGRICVTGNSSTHAVKLVSASTSTDVPGGAVMVNMSGCVPGQFQFAALPIPLTLQAGASYYLASQESSGGDRWYDHGAVSTTPVAAVNTAIYSYDGLAWISANSFGMSYGPPNLRYSVAAGSTVPVTVTTNPSGLSFSVDGAGYSTAQTFAWIPGSAHSISVGSQQSGQTGTQYVWTGWTDGGALLHTVNPGTATTITANFTTQYLLSTNVVPGGSGSITANPASATGYYDSGTAVQLTAAPANGSTLVNWSGDLSGSSNPQTVIMSAPRTIAANFTPAGNLSNFVTGYGSTGPVLRSDFGGWVGMKITVGGNPLNVSTVGRACISGNYQTHTVKFVTANNPADVPGASASVNLSGCTGGQIAYGFLASPVTLQPGATYYLVTQEFAGGDRWYDLGRVSTTSAAAVNSAVYSQDGATWTPISGANNSYVPPSFQYSNQSNQSSQNQTSSQTSNPAFITGYALNAPSLRNDFSGWVGTKFTVGSSSLTTASLGRICIAGNSLSHAVKFVDAGTGTDLPGGSVTVNMAGCPPGQFQYSVLSNPPTLQAGASYYLASQESSGGDRWYDFGTLSTTSVAAVNNPVYSYDGAAWNGLSVAGMSYVPPNFQYAQGQAASAGSSGPFVTGYNLNSRPLRNDFSGWVGMSFTVTASSLTVTSLGRICASGNSAVHLVKLVSADSGADVPEGSLTLTMSGCSPGQFQYANLSSPITLPAGGRYNFVSQESVGGDQWYDWALISTTGAATVTSAVYSGGVNWMPIGGPNYSYVPLNFK